MAFNVLIVDDSSSMRSVIKKTLEISGFDIGRIFEAGNGREALDVLDKEWADIILTDIHMPDMDGISFLKELQKDEAVSSTRVVVVTTDSRDERIDKLMDLGIDAWIQKPFRPEQIKKVLLDVLDMNEQTTKGNADLDGCDF